MKITTTGEIFLISPIEHRGRYRKVDFAIRTPEGAQLGLRLEYNRVFDLNDFEVGDSIEVGFEVKGHIWTGKVINNFIVESIRMINPKGTELNKRIKQIQKEKREREQF